MAGTPLFIEKHVRRRPDLIQSLFRELTDSFEAVGTWCFTILCLAVIGLTVHLSTRQAPVGFYLQLTYATAFSLMLASPVHAMYTRQLLDEIFLGRIHAVINGLLAASVLTACMAMVCAAALVFPFSFLPLNQKIGFIVLMTFLSLFWCVNSTLSALQKERSFFFLFCIGMAVTLLLFFGARPRSEQPQALVLIFSVGIAIPVAGGYGYVIKSYLRDTVRLDWQFLHRPDALRSAFSLGAFYAGIWIDKFLFWFSRETGQASDPLFRYCPEYDFPFFAAITIMMIGSVLVYRGMKRRVTEPYKAFVFKLDNNFPFRDLALEKYRLFYGIGRVAATILIVYGGVVLYILFFLYIRTVPLPWNNPFVFHYLLVGTVFFSLYFFYFLIIQYLDDFKSLLLLNLLFLVLNAAGTFLSIIAGPRYYGAGFMLAALISALIAFVIVNKRVGGLEFEVFRKSLKSE